MQEAEKAANLEAYRAQKQEMEATFGALLKQLPKDTEVPGLLDDITRTALDNELTIESIDLQAERQLEFYVELPIDIVVEGTYHKIGTFRQRRGGPVADRHAARLHAGASGFAPESEAEDSGQDLPVSG